MKVLKETSASRLLLCSRHTVDSLYTHWSQEHPWDCSGGFTTSSIWPLLYSVRLAEENNCTFLLLCVPGYRAGCTQFQGCQQERMFNSLLPVCDTVSPGIDCHTNTLLLNILWAEMWGYFNSLCFFFVWGVLHSWFTSFWSARLWQKSWVDHKHIRKSSY